MLETDVWEWGPFLRRRWKSIAVVTIATMAVTAAVTYYLPPAYQSTATLMVQPLAQDQPLAYPSATELTARNIGELIKSPAVEQRAAEYLHQGEIRGEPEYRVLENSGLIQVTVIGASPDQAAREASAIANAFIAVNAESLAAGADSAQRGLDAQLAKLRGQVAATEGELAAARSAGKGTDAITELQDKLDTLNTAYEGVLADAQLLPSSEVALTTSVHLADAAVPDPEPVSPRPALNLVLAVAGGLLLGMAYARATEPRAKRPGAGS